MGEFEKDVRRVHDKQINVYCDYLVYFDSVCMNDFVLSYHTHSDITNGEAYAEVEFIYAPSFDRTLSYAGIDNSTNVRIFEKNVFSDKYVIVFDGMIKQKSRKKYNGTWTLSFVAMDYLYWANRIVAPVSLPFESQISPGERLRWKAQSISPDTTDGVTTVQAGSMKGKKIKDFLDMLKQKTLSNSRIYSDYNTVVNFDDTVNRIVIGGDMNDSLAKKEVIDFVVSTNTVFANTFMVSMNTVTQNLHLELYQDREGIIYVKPPFWTEPVLYSHVLDASLVISCTRNTDWQAYYTRIIAQGGVEEWMKQKRSEADLLTPISVYLGNLKDESKAQYTDYRSEGDKSSSFSDNPYEYNDSGERVYGDKHNQPTKIYDVSDKPGWIYPLAKKAPDPGVARSTTTSFEAARGMRLHAGIDLVTNGPVDVLAMDDGVIIGFDIDFYDSTDVLAIRHTDGSIARYCEISFSFQFTNSEGSIINTKGEYLTRASEMYHVKKGQVIGQTARNDDGGYMLHLEMYSGVLGGKFYRSPTVDEHSRRDDLQDPTRLKDLPMYNE